VFGDLTASGVDLTIDYDAATNVLTVTSSDGTVDRISLDGITSVVINGTAGDDTLHIDTTGLPDGISLVVDGGNGTDTIVGPSSDVTWTIDGAGSGQVDRELAEQIVGDAAIAARQVGDGAVIGQAEEGIDAVRQRRRLGPATTGGAGGDQPGVT